MSVCAWASLSIDQMNCAPKAGRRAAAIMGRLLRRQSSVAQAPGLRSYPVIGSMLNLPADNVWHLQRRAARANAPDIYLMFANGYSKMGHFCTMGFPGVGEGVHGTIYICSDPEEYRMPGADEPGGATRGALNIFGHGEAWRQERMFFQQDLQTPKAARGYIPGLAKAAQLA
ncbi:hypothetical protein EMIHUDRAFT_230639 [Emiliania huxleyi CCMP1516]|uniref:Cytochrome P450 n=2 Tax=Emiliania huxleyi TaxID=2903 RepID=A0A0D3KA63_EMIH1|nr:hypothetical protein EMIHUDRAFT_230639 [Emiliania huxleyi CCMP1516]EOD32648.1 hypothetical protein EMIHUDRAFT_230639 [Emiliania huxleyi CCMP1516]|eukprot:XP_005785077.1 hypothetical protein EMIHUDRAFT_230639 [Emiliania huxleyi CCMP1516]